MQTTIHVDGEEFVVVEDTNLIFVGKRPAFSQIAAQLMVHEVMKGLRMKPAKVWTNVKDEAGNIFLAVGYRMNWWDRLIGKTPKAVTDHIAAYVFD